LLTGIVQGADRQRGVRAVSEQHVFCRPDLVVRAVPGERGVGGGERVAGLVLLQARVRACGGDDDVPDLRPRDVEQPARAHGVLELLRRHVLCELRGDRDRDVSAVSARAVVVRGQPELQLVPRELARCGGERVDHRLCLRRGVYRACWQHVRAVCGGDVQGRDRVGRVQRVPGADVVGGGG